MKATTFLFISVSLVLILISTKLFSQEKEFKKTSIKTGIGLAMNEGDKEFGNGLVYAIGFQKSYGKKDKLRINPNFLFGGFLPAGITDTPDMYYKLSSLGLDLHYDILKVEIVSLAATVGGFMNYSRGLIGTGGMPPEGRTHSDYFLGLYFGGKVGLGLRFAPENGKLAFEFKPFNVQFGNKGFFLGAFMFGVDIRLEK